MADAHSGDLPVGRTETTSTTDISSEKNSGKVCGQKMQPCSRKLPIYLASIGNLSSIDIWMNKVQLLADSSLIKTTLRVNL